MKIEICVLAVQFFHMCQLMVFVKDAENWK